MSGINITEDIRMAGRVSRYHTWPHTRPQSVAEHSWQVARILMAIAPGRHSLVSYAIVHDIGEVKTGDIPYPVKKENPTLRACANKLEDETSKMLRDSWMVRVTTELTDTELFIFKLAEMIEMAEWGYEEVLTGNSFALLVYERCATVVDRTIQENLDNDNIDIKNAVGAALEYWTRRKVFWGIEHVSE